ncbi:MAG TPA: CoA pyrophosphatase [Candidatus Acidoferrales bacterium]|nr:CoA pyrophosphatase [Candidatus Acidoferrales bacterium]
MKRVSIADLEPLLARPARPARFSMAGKELAAVCVPLHEAEGDLQVWLIKRPDRMRHHSREIAFPGGKRDHADADLWATALREACEELGLEHSALRRLGGLRPVPTATSRFAIQPYVVEVAGGTVPRPEAREVAALIRTPLAGFFEGAVPYRAVDFKTWVSPIFVFPEGALYGASAHVLQELLEVYAEASGRELPGPVLTTEIPWA